MPLTIPQVAPNVDGLTQRTGFNAAITQIYQNMVDQAAVAFATGGTAPAFTLTPTPALAAYATGVRYHVAFGADATSPTLNVSGLGAKNIKQFNNLGAKVAATIKSGMRSDVVYDGTDFVLLDQLPTGGLIGFRVFAASGTYSKGTNNPSHVIVELVGGGGSGGVAWTSLTAAGIGSSGGGGGGYSRKRISASSLAASETVTIGDGGTGVSLTTSGATAGNAGGTTSFGSHCSATGGAAGQATRNTSSSATAVAAASGGSGSGGDFNTSGHASQASFTYIKDSNVGSIMGGSGGGSLLGGGGPGLTNNGNTATPGGYGGGSAGAVGTTGTVSSGNGAKGVVIVWEFA